MSEAGAARRAFWAPEVIQTSSIDCGPACLRSAFAGHRIDVSYDLLRDACQTNVDGTSIDALEEVANRLGLAAEQIWVPTDHLTMPEISPLPAVCVTQLPGGPAHFVLAWRQVGGLFQIMDPSTGRRWVSGAQLAGMSYLYELEIDASVWRDWASTPEFEHAIGARLRAVHGDEALLDESRADPSPVSLACLDAAIRMVGELSDAGAVRRGRESRALLSSLHARAVVDLAEGAPGRTVPEAFYSALPLGGEGGERQVRLRGAIVLRLRGRREPEVDESPARGAAGDALAPEAARAVRRRPWAEAARLLRREGALTWGLVAFALAAGAALGVLEALMLRGALDVAARLQGPGQRLTACLLLVAFVALATAFELWEALAVRAVGRRFELRLRADFLAKVPLLSDVYFRSRPASDMAHRAHAFHPIRNLPLLGGRIARLAATLVVTLAGLFWLDPEGWPLALAAGAICIAVPWFGQTLLTESDLKVRVHDGRLAQFNLDALLGLMPIRAHGAERAVRWEHAAIVFEWVRACKERLRLGLSVELAQALTTGLLAVFVVAGYVRRSTEPSAVLLLAYWVLGLPAIGQAMATLTRQLPRQRNLLDRVLEPVLSDATVAPPRPAAGGGEGEAARAAALHFDGVSVVVGGHQILDDVRLAVGVGEHVAVVGPSGAGKSTLLGLLLGWHDAESGRVLVDGAPLDPAGLRRRTAWVDPAVTLWGRPLLDNVRYGSELAPAGTAAVLQQAELLEVLERMPDGLQTELGEGGRLVSGGEGQRVRLARALAKANVGLALLDEPFRGLERPMRERLLRRARALWKGATLLCVTHDLSAALDFDRVVVVEGGRVAEQGPPRALLEAPGGRFAELVRAEREVHRSGWNDPAWRRLRVARGAVEEAAPASGRRGEP